MDERLDPTCAEARALEARHREQSTLLVGGSGGQLTSLVRQTQDRQILAHLGRCARCSSHKNARCTECHFDLRSEPHGWRCPQGKLSWTDYLPWNWRAKKAEPLPTAQGHVPVHLPDRPVQAAAPAAPPPRPPARRAVSPPAAKPAPSPLAQAYAVLGVTSAATPEQVRAAYRKRAQEYHPDKVGNMAPEFRALAEQKMKEINDAYARLKRAA